MDLTFTPHLFGDARVALAVLCFALESLFRDYFCIKLHSRGNPIISSFKCQIKFFFKRLNYVYEDDNACSHTIIWPKCRGVNISTTCPCWGYLNLVVIIIQ